MNKNLIIIPTYNEQGSVEELVNEIIKFCPDTDILFIDDNSKDGTREKIYNLKDIHSNISLIERPSKSGLASAYIAGFNYALNKNYEYIVQMDADLSHNPAHLPTFFANKEKADFIIGSRYIEGGGVSNWSKLRKFISSTGNLYAKLILRTKITDFTGGFNLWKKDVLQAINLKEINANGYSFQIEMKYRALNKHFRFQEVPIIFEERSSGKSKMQFPIITEAIWRVWQFLFLIKPEKKQSSENR